MTYGRATVCRWSLPLLSLLFLSLQSAEAIFGGEDTEIDEFPWTALIEFQKPDGSSHYLCGGSLINKRYILTAATCVSRLPSGYEVKRVRLGEWDVASAKDCRNNFCSPTPIDVGIEQMIVHPSYSARKKLHDIALIRLARDVQYSNTVHSIELPQNLTLGATAIAVGWGQTETDGPTAETKQKVELDIVDMEECARLFMGYRVELDRTHLCAGGQKGKDTCRGDTGASLVQKHADMWNLVGIASFGSTRCGAPGIPGVYTNVAEYVDWIRETME